MSMFSALIAGMSMIYTLAGVFDPSKYVSIELFYIYATIIVIMGVTSSIGCLNETDKIKAK